MLRTKIRKGLDLPIDGAPEQVLREGPKITSVAVIGRDYVGLKPTMLVQEGERVKLGQPLFNDKKNPDVNVVSPGGGTVREIRRGARRVLQSVIIDLDEEEEEVTFRHWPADRLYALGRGDVVSNLLASGLWTALRTRPYSKVPHPDTDPDAIFVTAMDSNPLAADPEVIIGESPDDFVNGLAVVNELTEGPLYVCKAPDAEIPVPDLKRLKVAEFEGPHPSGLVGTHIHFLHPVSAERTVWHLGYQDVIAIGRLMQTGRHDPRRVVALTGPACRDPRIVRTIAGASMLELAAADLPDAPVRLISGSVLSGRAGEGASAYLGRYARQITLIEEDRAQIPFGWIRPMASKYAVQPVLGSARLSKLFPLTSNLNGGRRAMVPLGTFEELMPQDFLPTQLLRSLLVMDTDQAQALGALELDEEDLGLVGFACPAKYEYGLALRDCLTRIEKEG